jgi:hypothetical protein
MLRTEICNRRTLRVPMSQCDAPGSAERDPDDGFVERPWRAAAAFVRRTGLPAGDGPCRTAAERVRHSRMTPVPQPSVTLVTEAPTLMGIDPFVPGSMLLTYPRSETRDANAGSPRSNRVLGYRWLVQGASSSFLPEGSRDSRALDHFCHHDCNASTKAQTLSPRDPQRAFGLATENRLLLRAAPTDHPKATARCRRCPAPLFSDPFCTRLRNA